jgi:hypothetical protein
VSIALRNTKRLFIPTAAMRLQHHPVLRHLRSLTAIGVGDHSHALATADRFHISVLLLEDAQRRRAARHNLDLPFPHSLPSKGTARRPHTSAATFPQLLGCAGSDLVATTWPPNGIKLSSRASYRRRQPATAGSEIKYNGYPIAGQTKLLTPNASDSSTNQNPPFTRGTPDTGMTEELSRLGASLHMGSRAA